MNQMYYYPYFFPNLYYVNPHGYYHVRQPVNMPIPYRNMNDNSVKPNIDIEDRLVKDHGKRPFTLDIEEATKENDTFRTAIWTGEHLQVTLMSIPVGEDIGLENHPMTDQFLRLEDGEGIVQMGRQKDRLDYNVKVSDDDAIMVPAGFWHNIVNTGDGPLKLYSIYAPPEHRFGTVHQTKEEAMYDEHV
jgi:mannose-6-phosphate isomerase-like protein (cupin superfamily)